MRRREGHCLENDSKEQDAIRISFQSTTREPRRPPRLANGRPEQNVEAVTPMHKQVNFLNYFNVIWVVQFPSQKYSASQSPQISGIPTLSRSHKRALPRVAVPVGTAATNDFDIPTTGQTRQRLQRSQQDPQLLLPTRSADFAHKPNAKALLGRQCYLLGHVSRGCASATEPAPT
jgi:hypothetical protein